MHIYLGSDHGGFDQKSKVLEYLKSIGAEYTDCGAHNVDTTDDYPDFAIDVAKAISEHPKDRGILLCRSGEGMEIVANKFPNIRAALVWDTAIAQETRADNDANILVLPSDFVNDLEATEIVRIFLETDFSGEARHIRRLEKLHAVENTIYES